MCAGLSRPLQESEQHVPAGNHVGTIMYTAPEVFRDSCLTKPGDVYAFGIMSKITVCQLDNDLHPCHALRTTRSHFIFPGLLRSRGASPSM